VDRRRYHFRRVIDPAGLSQVQVRVLTPAIAGLPRYAAAIADLAALIRRGTVAPGAELIDSRAQFV
jgi:hypothetical protein